MRLLYLIPARGGSKGLPGKNIRSLGGSPLIAWSIEAAKNSRFKGRIVVSTDNETIAGVARGRGAEVPFMRPAELATDTSASIDVVFHALRYFEEQGETFDYVVLLQPTSPLRRAEDIDGALRLLEEKKVAAVVSVCKAEHHPLWCNTLPADGSMKDFIRPEIKGKNRQQLPEYYRLNGAVFIASPAYLEKNRTFIGDGAYAFEMPSARSIDIDTEVDFQLAEVLLMQDQKEI